MGQRLIGVDVGGTKVSVAVLEDGVLSNPHICPTDLSSSEALVEAHDDDMRPIADIVVMFTVGTGVGGGIVIGGRTFRGSTGAAPEIGHTIIGAALDHGAPAADGFPHPASLEYHAAGRALDRLGLARGIGDGHAVVAAARDGDAEALDAIRICG